MPQQYKSAKRAMKKPAMSHGNKPKMYGNKPKQKTKHSLGKDVVAEYAKKGISEKVLNTFGTTSSDTVTVKSRGHRGINPRAGAALKLSGKSSGNVRLGPLGKNSKELMTRGQGKKEKQTYAMADRTYTQDNKKELAGKVMMYKNKPNAKFPDLSGDGKVTKKDILMGRGVIEKPKMLKNKRKDIAGKAMMAYAKPAMYGDKPKMYGDKPKMYGDKPKGYVSDAQRKAVHASKADGGKGNPNKPKMAHGKKPKKIVKTVTGPHGTGKHHTMTRVNTKKGKVTHKDVSKKKADRISKRNLNKGMKEAEKGYKK